MTETTITTGEALARMNYLIKKWDPRITKPLRRVRRSLVHEWLNRGWSVPCHSQRVQGVPVAPDKLLTDEPGLLSSIAAGAVTGFMVADRQHPATEWLVQVNGVRYLTANEDRARDLFCLAMNQAMRRQISESGANHDAH